MTSQLKVALLIETSNSYARGLLQGVVAYLREHRPWSIYLAEHGRGAHPPSWLAGWKGEGILARVENEAMAAALRPLDIPIVDLSSARLIPKLPCFETDDAAFARLAVEHLVERGFKHLAFCGDKRFNWSNWRGDFFSKEVTKRGYRCLTYEPSRQLALDDEGQVEDIARWIKGLPKPVGIWTCYDLRGQQVLDACRQLGVAVPEEAAVIGADNDDMLCELSSPPLSSVMPNTQRTGYEAAGLLEEMMAGRKAEGATFLIPPLGIATRQSSDVLAVDDVRVAKAVHFIREHACKGINVQDVLKAVPHSRRLLENRFKKLIGRTPHEEITRVQLNRVAELLTQTDLPLEQIAERSGFTHVEYLSVVFKKKMGLPPSKYRQVNRK